MADAKQTLRDILEPMPGKIAVLVESRHEITDSGIVIPRGVAQSIHEQRHTQGEVIALGEEDLADPDRSISLGDIVVFGKFSGTKLTWQPPDGTERDRQEIIILTERDILAKLKSPDIKVGVKT